MNRRFFIKQSCVGALLFSSSSLFAQSQSAQKRVRFGLVTDIHFAHRSVNGTRYYEHSLSKLTEALSVFNREKLDFLIELGDLKDQGEKPSRVETLSFLDEVEAKLQTFDGPLYHVLGNHDMDSISKSDFLTHTTNSGKAKGKKYYTFENRFLKMIVLDGNYNADGTDYNTGNFTWTQAYIPREQQKWLQKELKKGDKPVIVFIHQLLDYFSDIHPDLCLRNAAEIVPILEASQRVLAVFQGHHHPGHYSSRKGIHYFTMPGMIEGEQPAHTSYAVVEVDPDGSIFVNGFGHCLDRVMK